MTPPWRACANRISTDMAISDCTSRLYVLRDHEPIRCNDADVWIVCWIAAERQVAWDKLNESVTVSTLFTGIDTGIDEPELFQTLVFRDGAVAECVWYATWDESVIGHRAVCDWIQTGSVAPGTGTSDSTAAT